MSICVHLWLPGITVTGRDRSAAACWSPAGLCTGGFWALDTGDDHANSARVDTDTDQFTGNRRAAREGASISSSRTCYLTSWLLMGWISLAGNGTASGALSVPGGGNWYRGNTHTHARFSDSNDVNDVPAIAGWYKAAGYDFLTLSEHNNNLAAKKVFGHDELTTPTFLMMRGLELSKSRHTLAFGINTFIMGEDSLQDAVTRTLDAGGVPILNHPQAPIVSAASFIATKGLNHFEVFNGGRPQHTAASEKLWDEVLSAVNGRTVYAVAADDNHYKQSNVGRGWIMVKAPALTAEAILDNVRSGNFYATTGIILADYQVNSASNRIDIGISSQNGDSIAFIGKSGVVLSTVHARNGTYQMKSGDYYVRAKITNADGKAAWTQPVFNREASN